MQRRPPGKLKELGRAYAEGVPSEQEMREGGFEPEDYANDFVEAWPENWPAFRLFNEIGNQWRVGTNGPIALDYGVLFSRMDRMRLSDDDYEQMFQDIRALEGAFLSVPRKTG